MVLEKNAHVIYNESLCGLQLATAMISLLPMFVHVFDSSMEVRVLQLKVLPDLLG